MENKHVNLVNDKFKVPEKVVLPKNKVSKKVNLNWIVLLLFILFTIFFLYHCKKGNISEEEYKVVPYNNFVLN
jgi:isochorismate hydrolase